MISAQSGGVLCALNARRFAWTTGLIAFKASLGALMRVYLGHNGFLRSRDIDRHICILTDILKHCIYLCIFLFLWWWVSFILWFFIYTWLHISIFTDMALCLNIQKYFLCRCIHDVHDFMSLYSQTWLCV